jgi:sugar/nucleoside kinase (ribokinase family)
MDKQVVVAGHVCLDVFPLIENAIPLTPGRLYEVGPALMATGGTVSNVGVALHLLGIPAVPMGKVGDDSFGRSILGIFSGYSPTLTAGMKVAPGATTSYTIVINIPGTDRIFLHCPGANHTFTVADLDLALIGQSSLFHFGYPPLMASTYSDGGDNLTAIFRTVRERGVATSLDMAMPDPQSASGRAPWADILRRVLPYVDIFLPSADELLYMLDRSLYGQGEQLDGTQASRLGQQLLDLGVAVAGLKLGARGLYLRTAGEARLRAAGVFADPAAWADRELWFPVFRVDNFVGATGAGDTTIAGFLASILRGLGPTEAGAMANAVGACNVQAADALSGLRSWDATRAYRQTTPLAPLTVPGQGWRQDPQTRLWHGPHDRG